MERDEKHDITRLTELAHVGASQAAEAFAQLVGQPITAVAPIVSDAGPSSGVGDPEATGVFFELEGCLDAIIGIVFPGRASDRLVRQIVGMESCELEPTIVESALMEVGNILASHVSSAISDRLGERLLPSIPSLSTANAEIELEVFIERVVGESAMRIESGLANEDGGLRGYLVLAPTG